MVAEDVCDCYAVQLKGAREERSTYRYWFSGFIRDGKECSNSLMEVITSLVLKTTVGCESSVVFVDWGSICKN